MKLDCEVIRDLLPLYVERVASPSSAELIEEHLKECEACRAELKQMQMPVPVQPECQPEVPLKKIRDSIRRKNIRMSIAAVLVAMAAVVLVLWMGAARTLVDAEEAGFWVYSKKEDGVNLCVLEVQGEGVELETTAEFSWGTPYITVRAVRYRFPRVHAALTRLAGSDEESTSVIVSRTQLLTVDCANETRYYRDSQQVQRFIVGEKPDGGPKYAYGTEQEYGRSFKKG